MKERWHGQIQRYLAGDTTPEETAALQQALKDDAELRTLYLDYLNLDVALGVAAEAAKITENGSGRMTPYSRPLAKPIRHDWRWLAATGACAALVMLTILPKHRDPSRTRYDFSASITSSQDAIARLSIAPTTSLPGWMSPTASMLEPQVIPE